MRRICPKGHRMDMRSLGDGEWEWTCDTCTQHEIDRRRGVVRHEPPPGFEWGEPARWTRADAWQEDSDHEQDKWNDRGGFPALWPWEK